MSRSRCSGIVLFGLLCVVPSIPAAAQGVIVNLYPREVERGRVSEELAREASNKQVGVNSLSEQERATVVRRVRERSVSWLKGWTDLEDEDDAARLWAAADRIALLPGVSLSPGQERTAIYAELAYALTGAWRFAIGSTLAVQSDEEEETETGGEQAPDQDTGTGFSNFLAGGGNLSFSGVRPLAFQNGNYSSHLIMAVPRVWTNIPSLSPTDGIDDFGGEAAIEYQYQRYERKIVEGDTLSATPKAPFLTLQTRVGGVWGTNAFYEGVGRSDSGNFFYTVPTVSMNFTNGVKVGASYFYGFGALKEHESIRLHLTLAPRPR